MSESVPVGDTSKVAETAPHWRVGRKLGRTLYLNDEFVGVMDTRELANQVVEALSATPKDG